MTKIEFVTHERNGLNYISLAPPAKPMSIRLKWLDRVFFGALLAGFIGLLFFLIK